ncbi:MAG: NAD(P)/FAD-dependent oxidoreductase, partial [Sphingomonadales bacterium]|nr:NAD(P)/FAD-dependent oxidoreductase [Sphingomonadales bacterium]
MSTDQNINVAIIGAGPAGLMAAEVIAKAGLVPHIFDAMPTPARKLLMAGKSGLNLTHGEDLEVFLTRYSPMPTFARDAIRAFPPETIRDWAKNLGIETFAGSSGRVFPKEMKASPLLRAWLKRLDDKGAVLHTRHRWTGLDADGGLTFDTPDGPKTITARATVLALGGGSWPKLGSDAGWVKTLADKGVSINPLKSA